MRHPRLISGTYDAKVAEVAFVARKRLAAGSATSLLSGRGRARYPADVTVEIAGAGAVVTGAGSGIGRALARGLAAAGARVVVNDLNFEAATAVAKEIGGFPAPGDAATEPGVSALIATARDCLGEIDIY